MCSTGALLLLVGNPHCLCVLVSRKINAVLKPRTDSVFMIIQSAWIGSPLRSSVGSVSLPLGILGAAAILQSGHGHLRSRMLFGRPFIFPSVANFEHNPCSGDHTWCSNTLQAVHLPLLLLRLEVELSLKLILLKWPIWKPFVSVVPWPWNAGCVAFLFSWACWNDDASIEHNPSQPLSQYWALLFASFW